MLKSIRKLTFWRAIKLGVLAYAIFVVLAVLFERAKMQSPGLERLAFGISPAKTLIMIGDRLVEPSDLDGGFLSEDQPYLSQGAMVHINQADIVVILMDELYERSAYQALINWRMIRYETLRSFWESGKDHRFSRSSLFAFDASIPPHRIESRTLLLVNAPVFAERYRGECHQRLIYNIVLRIDDDQYETECLRP